MTENNEVIDITDNIKSMLDDKVENTETEELPSTDATPDVSAAVANMAMQTVSALSGSVERLVRQLTVQLIRSKNTATIDGAEFKADVGSLVSTIVSLQHACISHTEEQEKINALSQLIKTYVARFEKNSYCAAMWAILNRNIIMDMMATARLIELFVAEANKTNASVAATATDKFTEAADTIWEDARTYLQEQVVTMPATDSAKASSQVENALFASGLEGGGVPELVIRQVQAITKRTITIEPIAEVDV